MMFSNRQCGWVLLDDHARMSANKTRALKKPCHQQLNASACQIFLDYSNQPLSTQTLTLLFDLAEQCQLRQKIHALMRGDRVNVSQNRPALHTALRALDTQSLWVEDENIIPAIVAARRKMQHIVEQIRSQTWLGYSGKPIKDIVNIGIGGSDLGARFCINALKRYTSPELGYHFISDVDPNSFHQAVTDLDPETTLFIVASKSFTTQETLYNMRKAIFWVGKHVVEKHFIAVTAYPERAHQWGISTVLPIWDWVGGRYSLCSSINLITAIAIGFDAFYQVLEGAHSMDKHFHDAAFDCNLPVLLALLGVWNNNFLHIHQLLILTYALQLEHFVPFIQQLDMESNGKSVDNQGREIDYATGPIVWGGLGNQAQHSYYQLLCQGTHRIAADFITLDIFNDQIINQMCEAKIKVLTEGVLGSLESQRNISAQISLNHIHLQDDTPFTIGALVSLYEHKIFAQSVIWNINPFDQPGVESAKRYREMEKESICIK